MKTTQRSFVVAFKSGRRQLKMGPKSIWGDTDLKALAREVEDKASHLFSSNEASSTPDIDGDMLSNLIDAASASEDAVDLDVARPAAPSAKDVEADVTTQHQANRSADEGVAQVQESGPASQPHVTTIGVTQNRAKRASGRRIPHISMTALGDQGGQSETAVNPISVDEVAVLDAENKRLKKLLVEQLRGQNLQLEKMLERFAVT
ncbi:hypothetical protein [Rhizobium rhizogenes]|uniref:hypothetical protein n=1 Tax=Rhizobium rhizogenes TaxID=359 RepID=UPI0015725A6E|nr:hypothetical protein [Rhizobium rhizogenes]NTG64809.1 hypothetical protein [Rhizobium rhizogenes]NTH68516.1 hypothetical protein [Rhizobium rhizogenes]NTI00012.1 hypothetical protein [Rhizobium rhizogenes]NTI39144.1 hypothetical protein [Rhizobium rhizogenes]NTJ18303.1 hypothetical protein [Rhizobium rhizogenes]